jgi:PHD/YefM family antitoxin component YafN of YafNO toxin-antitoxin module
MIIHLPISETRKKITSLADNLSPDETISVTKRGKEVLAILPWETYEALLETLEIMSDKDLMSDLQKGIEEYRKGNLVDPDEVERLLDIV